MRTAGFCNRFCLEEGGFSLGDGKLYLVKLQFSPPARREGFATLSSEARRRPSRKRGTLK